jgi:hypothetical protein
VKIGGPCDECGAAQVEHVGKTCADVRTERAKAFSALIGGALACGFFPKLNHHEVKTVTPSEKQNVEAVLMRSQLFHVFVHIADDRVFEFLGTQKPGGAKRNDDGSIDLELLGDPGQGEDPSIFKHIRHQLAIDFLPIDTNPRFPANLPLRHSRVELGSFEGKSLRLRMRIVNVGNARAVDIGVAEWRNAPDIVMEPTKIETSGYIAPMPTEVIEPGHPFHDPRATNLDLRTQFEYLRAKRGEMATLLAASLSYLPAAMPVGDLLARKLEFTELRAQIDAALNAPQTDTSAVVAALRKAHVVLGGGL